MPNEEELPKFCLVFAETTPQLVNRRGSKEVECSVRLVSDANFDREALRRHMKGLDDYKRTLESSRGRKQAEEDFREETVENGSG